MPFSFILSTLLSVSLMILCPSFISLLGNTWRLTKWPKLVCYIYEENTSAKLYIITNNLSYVVFMKGREKGYKKSHYMYSHFSCVIKAVEHNKSIFAFIGKKINTEYHQRLFHDQKVHAIKFYFRWKQAAQYFIKAKIECIRSKKNKIRSWYIISFEEFPHYIDYSLILG